MSRMSVLCVEMQFCLTENRKWLQVQWTDFVKLYGEVTDICFQNVEDYMHTCTYSVCLEFSAVWGAKAGGLYGC